MFFRSTSLILSVALIAGCGRSGPRTYPVSGTVSMDGQPLATGKIFLIDPETHLDADVGDIVDGWRLRLLTGDTAPSAP